MLCALEVDVKGMAGVRGPAIDSVLSFVWSRFSFLTASLFTMLGEFFGNFFVLFNGTLWNLNLSILFFQFRWETFRRRISYLRMVFFCNKVFKNSRRSFTKAKFHCYWQQTITLRVSGSIVTWFSPIYNGLFHAPKVGQREREDGTPLVSRDNNLILTFIMRTPLFYL